MTFIKLGIFPIEMLTKSTQSIGIHYMHNSEATSEETIYWCRASKYIDKDTWNIEQLEKRGTTGLSLLTVKHPWDSAIHG